MNKRIIQYILILTFIANKSEANEIPPKSFDEYEVIESVITEDISPKSWELSNQNIRGVDFKELHLTDDLKIIDHDEHGHNEEIIYRGKINLRDKKGVIYSIVDPIAVENKLNIKTKGLAYINSVGKIEEPIEFFTYTNYKKDITKYEIRIYDSKDVGCLNPYSIISGETLSENEPIKWNGIIDENEKLDSDQRLSYILRVYDENGEYDETYPREIFLKNSALKSGGGEKISSIKEDIYGISNIKIRNIVASGAKVKFYGRDLYNNLQVKLDNQNMEIDSKGDFIYEIITDSDKEYYNIEVIDGDESKNYILESEVPEDYEFLVGLADFIYGKNEITGNDAILKNNPDFQASYYNKGRLAAYYKAVKNKYKITAQVDTWSKEIKYMFSDFYERDADTIFRKIDKDYLFFNYGDDSEIYSDVDTQGKAYLRVDWDKSQVLWGNYETELRRGEYFEYSRSLYGARTEYNSLSTNGFGESKYQLMAFGSKPYTTYKRDTFLGTGGSIYYLSERDIVLGSAKLVVEVKNKTTDKLVSRKVLIEGKDYTINELTGRVILDRPLTQESFIQASNDIIKDTPSTSYYSYLVVDYEFYSSLEDFSDIAYGLSGKSWITDNIGVGGTYIKEDRDEDLDYDLKAVDITLKKSDGTYIYGEISETDGNQLLKDSNWFSYNGGYDFEEQVTLKKSDGGRAYYLEGSLVPHDYFENIDPNDRVKTWYSKKEKGFSTAANPSGVYSEEYGLSLEHNINEKLALYLKNKYYKEIDYTYEDVEDSTREEKVLSLGAEYELNDKITLATEIEYQDKTDDSIDEDDEDDIGEGLLIGGKVAYEVNERVEVYTKLQSSVWRDNGYAANNLLTLGSKVNVTDKLEIGAGVSTGNRGDAAEATASYLFNPDYEIYAGYHYEDQDDLDTNTTIGQRFSYSEKVNLYQENSYIDNSSQVGILQSYGIDYEYDRRFTFDLMYQLGNLDIDEGKIDRQTVSTGIRYEDRRFFTKHKLELGKDSGARDANSYGTINKFKWIPKDEYTVFGEANFIYTEGDLGTIKDDITSKIQVDNKYYELGLGFAYRPIFNDRLNLITAWNYIYDVDNRQGSIGLSEKANVFSVETIYDVTKELSIAAKYAIRNDEVRLNSGGDWNDNTISLYAVRATYELIYRWDLFAEYHWLESDLDNEKRSGAILAIYRDITENFQFGVGYNFSEFTDDLTDMDYKENGKDLDYKGEGWFINLIGKF